MEKFRAIGLAALILSLVMTLACQAEDAPKGPSASSTAEKKMVKLVDADEAQKLIAEKKVLVLDVRTPREYAAGHIEGSTNIDFRAKDFKEQVEKLSKDQPVLVHCAVGGRSAKACKVMDELDFKTIYDLKGGLGAWKEAGKPVVK